MTPGLAVAAAPGRAAGAAPLAARAVFAGAERFVVELSRVPELGPLPERSRLSAPAVLCHMKSSVLQLQPRTSLFS